MCVAGGSAALVRVFQRVVVIWGIGENQIIIPRLRPEFLQGTEHGFQPFGPGRSGEVQGSLTHGRRVYVNTDNMAMRGALRCHQGNHAAAGSYVQGSAFTASYTHGGAEQNGVGAQFQSRFAVVHGKLSESK